MAIQGSNYPFPLGGHPNGRYRTAASQASSGAANVSNPADLGTSGTSPIALASQIAGPGGTVWVNGPTARYLSPGNAYIAGLAQAPQNWPEPVLENAGVRAGEITGYRAWVLESDGLLHGMFWPHTWQPGATEHAPKLNAAYGSGLHAFKDIGQAKREYFSAAFGPVVYGEIAMWGEVIEYERGWKAEYAAIRKLVSINDESNRWVRKFVGRPSKLDDLRKRYGVAA